MNLPNGKVLNLQKQQIYLAIQNFKKKQKCIIKHLCLFVVVMHGGGRLMTWACFVTRGTVPLALSPPGALLYYVEVKLLFVI